MYNQVIFENYSIIKAENYVSLFLSLSNSSLNVAELVLELDRSFQQQQKPCGLSYSLR